MEKHDNKSTLKEQKKNEVTWLSAFGDAVSDTREQLNMTQQELADRSGVNRTYVSDIERGRRNVTITTMKRIAGAMNLDASDLLKRADRIVKSASFLRRVNGG